MKRTAALIAIAFLVAGPAAAPATAETTSASAVTTWGSLTFDKNPADPSNSRLNFAIRRDDGGNVRTIYSASYRAGSGLGSLDTCASSRGWLPNGTYDMKMHTDYRGSVIKGYAFQLNDKVCNGGTTPRTELFIHTEAGAGNVQCADGAGDEPCRWEPARNEYQSFGCIKLAPGDIKALHDKIRSYFGTSGSGGPVPFKLSVVS